MSAASFRLDPQRIVGEIDRRLFGSFVEHLGRCVYDGIYEPGHPEADEDGFRRDVIELVKELGVSTIRYPGGNFVSGYKWEDGVGPVAQRPTRLDLAWHSTESNEVGLHEFAKFLSKVDAELMLAVNLGTRGVSEAIELLEYSNIPSGTELADRRTANGAPEPFAVSMWCLGNEMDGPWQLGHKSADDYGKLAAVTAHAMKQIDPDLELVVCGSSGSHMPTFGAWERTVLEHSYDHVDLISCHAYYEEKDGDLASFLASAVDMDHFIEEVITAADDVKLARGTDKTINISFDEWNVWNLTRWTQIERASDHTLWPRAPRLIEDVYSVVDAVVVGGLLISLLRHADRVKSASLAQLVNVIAPIMTEPGGPSWRQTTFFPFSITSRLARGHVLSLDITSGDIPTSVHGDVAAIDAVATFDDASGSGAVFAVNRSLDSEIELEIDVSKFGDVNIIEAIALAERDATATNTLESPNRVAPRLLSSTVERGIIAIRLPPVSWSAISFSTGTSLSVG
jgi:alpha-L-arabinofuranosidase